MQVQCPRKDIPQKKITYVGSYAIRALWSPAPVTFSPRQSSSHTSVPHNLSTFSQNSLTSSPYIRACTLASFAACHSASASLFCPTEPHHDGAGACGPNGSCACSACERSSGRGARRAGVVGNTRLILAPEGGDRFTSAERERSWF